MIEEKAHIKYLYDLKHRNDSYLHQGFDYENKLFNKILSNVMFGNDKLKTFLVYLQEKMVWMIDSNLLIRNWWNFTVSKYYNKHNN